MQLLEESCHIHSTDLLLIQPSDFLAEELIQYESLHNFIPLEPGPDYLDNSLWNLSLPVLAKEVVEEPWGGAEDLLLVLVCVRAEAADLGGDLSAHKGKLLQLRVWTKIGMQNRSDLSIHLPFSGHIKHLEGGVYVPETFPNCRTDRSPF